MSFILDALKKSETERQRGDAPALYEVKMAPPRHGVAPWLLVLGGLLLINVVVLGIVLIRGTHGSAPAGSDTVATPPAAPPATPVTAAAPPPIAPPLPAATANSAPPVQATPPPPVVTPQDAPPAVAASADDAPAIEPPRGASGEAPPTVGGVESTGGNSGEVQTYQQAAAAPGASLPDLTLNLHSYSTNPADRFIFLNMAKLREGETSPQGVRVESITPEGAILSWHGSRFMLQRQ
ncbi:MAG TPA: general secretion pathway protein GspB [Steroidobacteraceae bacterium]|nr:general secretion pathway protein GspB [Steroidobacteraceae bacterium]